MEEQPVHPWKGSQVEKSIEELRFYARALEQNLTAWGDEPNLTPADRCEIDRLRARSYLLNLGKVADRVAAHMRELGVEAVIEGLLSRKGVAEILGVHQMTVGRWVTERKERGDPQSPSSEAT